MKPIATLLKQLSSILKIGATSGRASAAPFARWDRSHFERWTGAQAAGGARSSSGRWNRSAFQRWTQAPAKDAASGRKQTTRGALNERASQVQALYYR